MDAHGKRVGNFGLPHSVNRYVFSPMICAGTHGDEYAGLIIARRLFAILEQWDRAGRLILAPAGARA